MAAVEEAVKLRVKLEDGSQLKGLYLGREQAMLRFARLTDGSRFHISMHDVAKIRYRANRTKEGAGRGFHKGALWGAVTYRWLPPYYGTCFVK